MDESRNTDLIRWSDKGDSFIVLDEDEFAKTLIPELFKHNNYASFVRQLNMYGFHKRVGLSDNSMKASERKNKSPSEYYNPYFRRGHPNLLWLINKPKSGSKKKGKKEEVEAESEEDGVADETYRGQNLGAGQVGRKGVSNEIGPLQKRDLLQVKSQIERIQQQQVAISNMLNKIRQDQNQLYQQAVLFQNMHERHENSINAILNFLANVFRKSLEEQGGTQTVQDLLASIIPNAQGHGQNPIAPASGVVDLGGFVNQRSQSVASVGTPKRQQRLLPPIPPHKAASLSAASATPATAPRSPHCRNQMGTVTELFDTSPNDSTSPAYIESELRSNPQEGMMKLIQDTNAVNSSGLDLTDVASKTSASMSDDQRTKMLNIMAGGNPPVTSAAPNGIPVTAQSAPASMPASVPATAAPAGPAVARTSASLSPAAPSIPMPSLQEIQATQAELDELQRLQNEQANQIDELTNLLGPLSPSGRIPGLDEHGNPSTNYFDNVDYDQFINTNAFSDPNYEAPSFDGIGMSNNAENSDFNFSLEGNADYAPGAAGAAVPAAATGGASGPEAANTGTNGTNGNTSSSTSSAFEPGRTYDTRTSTKSPSPVGTEEISRAEYDSPGRGTKRRRKS